MIIVKIMVKVQKRTINSSKIHTPLAQGLVWMMMLMSRAENLQHFKSINLANS